MDIDLHSAIDYTESDDSINTVPIDLYSSRDIQVLPKSINRTLSFKNPPSPTILESTWKSIGDFFVKSPEQNIAESINAYQISKNLDIPIEYVNDNLDSLQRDPKITGMTPQMSREEYSAMFFAPLIAQGLATHFVPTAVSLGIFEAINPLYNLTEFEPKNANDQTKAAFEIADFMSKGAIAGMTAGVSIAGSKILAERVFNGKLKKLGYENLTSISHENLLKIKESKDLTDAQKESIFNRLGINENQYEAAINGQVPVKIPAFNILKISKEPYFNTLKEKIFDVKPDNTVVDASGKPVEVNPVEISQSEGVKNAESSGTKTQEGSQETQGLEQGTKSEVRLRNAEEAGMATKEGDVVTLQEGTGKERVHGTSTSTIERAIQKGFENNFKDLPTYKTRNMKEAAKKASDFIENNPELAKKIALNEAPEQDGIYAGELYVALESKAILENDIGMIKDLASSGVIGTEAGRRVKAFDTGEATSPVKAIKKVIESRQESSKKTTKETKEQELKVKELEDRLIEAEKRLEDLSNQKSAESVIKKSNSKSFGSKNKVFTQKGLEQARANLKKKLSGLRSGVDPTAIADMVKIGGYYFEAGARDFSVWSSKMVSEFGEKIRPFLSEAWSKITKKFYSAEKKDLINTISDKIVSGKDLSETSIQIQKLSENLVREGVNTKEKLVNKVHSILKKIIPDITKREVSDAISGYGKYQRLSTEEVKVKLRDLKGQLQQVSKLEDLQNKKPPLKTGRERRAISDEERRLIKQVENAKKEYNIQPTDPETQLRSALDSVKTRLRNQISDLEKQITENKKIVKEKRSVELDKEAQDLTERRDMLRKVFNQVFEVGKKTDEQRIKIAEKALKKSIATLEKKVKEGDISPINKESKTPETPALKRLREYREKLKKQLNELRELAKPQKTQEEISLQSLKTRLSHEAKLLEDKLNNMDLADKERTPIPLDPEAKKLKEEVDTLRNAYNAAKAVRDNITPEEVKTIVDLSKAVRESKDRMEKSPRRKEGEGGTKEEIAHGEALIAFDEYIESLSKDNSIKKDKLIKYLKNPLQMILDITGITKTLNASYDMSFIGNQGAKVLLKGLTGDIKSGKIWIESFMKSLELMAGRFGKKPVLRRMIAEMITDPDIDIIRKTGVDLSTTEEALPSNEILVKIPFLGKTFEAFGDAFTGASHYMRYKLIKMELEIVRKAGIDLTEKNHLESLGKLVNSLTGRGNLGKDNGFLQFVNNVFFSPRMLKGNFDVLIGHQLDPNFSTHARIRAAENTTRILIGGAMVLAIANAFDDKSVEKDSVSADFGKIKKGHTRFEFSGGLSPLLVLASRVTPLLIPGQKAYTKSSITGIKRELNSSKYGSMNGADIVGQFFENKFSPVMASVWDFLEGETFEGDKPSLGNTIKNLSVPFSVKTSTEVLSDPKSANNIVAITASVLGGGVNTYGFRQNWSNKPGKDLEAFLEKVGQKEFMIANREFNMIVDNEIDRLRNDVRYEKLSDDDKSKVIEKLKDNTKKEIFKKYNFKYKAERKKDNLEIKSILKGK